MLPIWSGLGLLILVFALSVPNASAAPPMPGNLAVLAQASGSVERPDPAWIERIDAWKIIGTILVLTAGALLATGLRTLWFSRRANAGQASDDRFREDSARAERSMRLRQSVIRILIVANLSLGVYYITWRYAASINWVFWPLALALLAAETYSFIDGWFFGSGMWKWHRRHTWPSAQGDETVDVFITCYNEPVDLVEATASAALRLNHPCTVYVCDDGANAEMQAMTERIGCNYITRSENWKDKERHAKAGNLINALDQTSGEFLLILDADQVPKPELLDQTLGYFQDPLVAFVQTPQWFNNVPDGDPFGSQAPLFYGPIQESKDGWNAAFFCGSNAVLRRDALIHAGLVNYARDLRIQLKNILNEAADRIKTVSRDLEALGNNGYQSALLALQDAVVDARRELDTKVPLGELTYRFQRRAQEAGGMVLREDFATIMSDLEDIPGVDPDAIVSARLSDIMTDPGQLSSLTGRETSPLQAIAEIRELLLRVDVDRAFEAMPVLSLSTISVTEDMATAMRLHALGYRSVYHPRVLVEGLAPEDLGTALQQRLRWAQGTIQVMFRENPLFFPGLKPMQRVMYFATMWSYLSGFFALVYLTAPILYLFFGWTPVMAFSDEFFWRLIPFLIINQILFILVAWGLPTWRGQQYSLALFPIWIKAVTSAIGSVYFGRKLGFVVTPKTRQSGVSLQLVRYQLIFVGLLSVAILVGIGRLVFDDDAARIPIAVNMAWALYDILALSVVFTALFYTPTEEGSEIPLESAASIHGRVGIGGR
jgi:cellulose synthase (UDP-forming)